MRCPKCGYISFDQTATCSRCAHNLQALAQDLQGPAIQVEPPFFLGSVLKEESVLPADHEELDFGEEEEAIDLEAMEEESNAGEGPETEAGPGRPQELSSLSGIDVSDLVPPGQETADALLLEEEDRSSDNADGTEISLEETTTGPGLSLDDNGEEAPRFPGPERGSGSAGGPNPAETAKEEVVDLSSLMDVTEELSQRTKTQTSAPSGKPEAEEDDKDRDLLLEDLSLEVAEETRGAGNGTETPASGANRNEVGLTLDMDEGAPLGGGEAFPEKPDIPDLGLALESDEQKDDNREES